MKMSYSFSYKLNIYNTFYRDKMHYSKDQCDGEVLF